MQPSEIFVRRTDRYQANNLPLLGGDKNFSFSIHELQNALNPEDEFDKPHRHPHFEIIWQTGGDGTCRLDLERYPIKNNVIYFIPPGHMHSLQRSESATGFMISFKRDFIHLTPGISGGDNYSDLLMENSCIFEVVKENEKEVMGNILCYLQCEFANYSLLRPDILSGWLKMFLFYLKGLTKISTARSDQTKNMELVRQFYASLEKDFLKKKMVIDYANELFISPNYLNEIVKRVSGFTASYHIQQRIILEAKRLAMYTTASMKEIAYLLGFEDIAYFSKFFKTFSGRNFRDFKRSLSFCEP